MPEEIEVISSATEITQDVDNVLNNEGNIFVKTSASGRAILGSQMIGLAYHQFDLLLQVNANTCVEFLQVMNKTQETMVQIILYLDL